MGWFPDMIKNNLNSQQRAEKESQKKNIQAQPKITSFYLRCA